MRLLDPVLLKETLNRTAKIDVDSGAAADFETAVERLRGHRIRVVAGPEVTSSAAHQAALLTVVNVARRFALGGVMVEGPLDELALAGTCFGSTLGEAVRHLGGVTDPVNGDVPTVAVGTTSRMFGRGIAVTFEGWRGGFVRSDGRRLGEGTTVMPAAVLAGALAAGEAFAILRGDVQAGRRSMGLSLWRPGATADWVSPSSDGPDLVALPDHLWVLGLGHLGQAFLWTLMLCPFAEPAKVRLTLQDMDLVTASTDSTSILTQPWMVGRRKTRAVAAILERRGFSTTLVERPFDGRFEHDVSNDPAVLVCGVDNALARSRLEHPGFPFVVEAGIGHRASDFRALRVHTFPSSGRGAAALWGTSTAEPISLLDRPAYRRLANGGGDVCGLTRLAETAVGAPFVGTVAGTLMLAQVLRVLADDAPDKLVDLDLRSPGSRRALVNGTPRPSTIGFQVPGDAAGRPMEPGHIATTAQYPAP